MISYLKVGKREPFVVICDGEYDVKLALARLDRDPFTFMEVSKVDSATADNYSQITIQALMRLHDGGANHA